MRRARDPCALRVGTSRLSVRGTLSGLADQLDPSQFVRVCRRFVVDVDMMQELQPQFDGDPNAPIATCQVRSSGSRSPEHHWYDNRPTG